MHVLTETLSKLFNRGDSAHAHMWIKRVRKSYLTNFTNFIKGQISNAHENFVNYDMQ